MPACDVISRKVMVWAEEIVADDSKSKISHGSAEAWRNRVALHWRTAK